MKKENKEQMFQAEVLEQRMEMAKWSMSVSSTQDFQKGSTTVTETIKWESR